MARVLSRTLLFYPQCANGDNWGFSIWWGTHMQGDTSSSLPNLPTHPTLLTQTQIVNGSWVLVGQSKGSVSKLYIFFVLHFQKLRYVLHFLVPKYNSGTGEMVTWLRALASLAERRGSNPSTWLCNSSSGGLSSLFSTPRGTRHKWDIEHTCKTHLKQKSIFLKLIFKLLNVHMLGRHSKYLCWVNDY